MTTITNKKANGNITWDGADGAPTGAGPLWREEEKKTLQRLYVEIVDTGLAILLWEQFDIQLLYKQCLRTLRIRGHTHTHMEIGTIIRHDSWSC